jgi:hypothetical protein
MFWVISTALVLRELPSRRGTTKNPLTRIFNFESAKASSVWKYLQPKFRLAFVLQNCVAFKEMDHCYVVCVVLRCKFSQLRLKC